MPTQLELKSMHNTLLQTRLSLEKQHKHSNTIIGFFELLFSEGEFNEQMAFWDVLTETAIIALEDKIGINRESPILPIADGKYRVIYERIKDDPNIGKKVINDIKNYSRNDSLNQLLFESVQAESRGTLQDVMSKLISIIE